MSKVVSCEKCDEFLPLGEGDFLCEVKNVIVVSDYTPTSNYFWCQGLKTEKDNGGA